MTVSFIVQNTPLFPDRKNDATSMEFGLSVYKDAAGYL